jgi:hypothetical protein
VGAVPGARLSDVMAAKVAIHGNEPEPRPSDDTRRLISREVRDMHVSLAAIGNESPESLLNPSRQLVRGEAEDDGKKNSQQPVGQLTR